MYYWQQRSPANENGGPQVARKTRQEALETRENLLDAAGKVFCEKGVTNSSLADIAACAGVTRGAVYWHFKNKTDLVEALWHRTEMPVDVSWGCENCSPGSNPLESIRSQALDCLRRAVADPNTKQVWDILMHKCENIDDAAVMKSRLRESRTECALNVTELFEAAIQAGQLPESTDVMTAINGLFCYIEGLIYNWLMHPDSTNLEESAEAYIDIYINGLVHRDIAVRQRKTVNG